MPKTQGLQPVKSSEPSPVAASSEGMRALLMRRYKHPEWSVQFEVANGTGGGRDRLADAVVMNLYASRGFLIHGVEIKVSRADWRRELATPQKAEAFASVCDYWWLLAPREIVRPGELPDGWGHLAPTSDMTGLEVVVAAKRRSAARPGREFIAAMLQQSARTLERALETEVAQRVRDLRETLRTGHEGQVAAAVEKATYDARDAVAAVQRVKASCGVDLTAFNADAVMTTAIQLAAVLKTGKHAFATGNLRRGIQRTLAAIDAIDAIQGRSETVL